MDCILDLSLADDSTMPLVNSLRLQTVTRLVPLLVSGLKITAGQRTMSSLIEALTGQTFDLPVMLTGQN